MRLHCCPLEPGGGKVAIVFGVVCITSGAIYISLLLKISAANAGKFKQAANKVNIANMDKRDFFISIVYPKC
jgi:hypothetical protein